MALSFPETSEQPHFDRPSFRVGRKIFATLDLKNGHAVLKLGEIDQSVFAAMGKTTVYPVPNKWGKQGWTIFVLETLQEDLVRDALATAYGGAAPPRLAAQVRPPRAPED